MSNKPHPQAERGRISQALSQRINRLPQEVWFLKSTEEPHYAEEVWSLEGVLLASQCDLGEEGVVPGSGK